MPEAQEDTEAQLAGAGEVAAAQPAGVGDTGADSVTAQAVPEDGSGLEIVSLREELASAQDRVSQLSAEQQAEVSAAGAAAAARETAEEARSAEAAVAAGLRSELNEARADADARVSEASARGQAEGKSAGIQEEMSIAAQAQAANSVTTDELRAELAQAQEAAAGARETAEHAAERADGAAASEAEASRLRELLAEHEEKLASSSDAGAAAAALQAQCDEQTAEIEGLRAKLAQAEAEGGEHRDAASKSTEQGVEIDQLRAELAQAEAESGEHRDAAARSTEQAAEIGNLRSQLAQAEAEQGDNRDAAAKSIGQAAEIDKLRAELELGGSEMEELRAKVVAAGQLQEQNASAAAVEAELRKQCEQSETTQQQLLADLSAEKEKVKQLEAQLEGRGEAQAHAADQAKEIERLERVLQERESALGQEIASLRQQLEEAVGIRDSLQAQVQQEVQRREAAEKSAVRGPDPAVAHLQEENMRLEKAMAELFEQHNFDKEALQNDVALAKHELEAMTQETDHLRSQLVTMEDALRDARASLDLAQERRSTSPDAEGRSRIAEVSKMQSRLQNFLEAETVQKSKSSDAMDWYQDDGEGPPAKDKGRVRGSICIVESDLEEELSKLNSMQQDLIAHCSRFRQESSNLGALVETLRSDRDALKSDVDSLKDALTVAQNSSGVLSKIFSCGRMFGGPPAPDAPLAPMDNEMGKPTGPMRSLGRSGYGDHEDDGL